MASYRETAYGWRAEVDRKGVYRSKSAFPTKGAAVAWASRVEAEIMAGERGEIPNRTVGELLKRYSEDVSEHKKGKRWEQIRLQALGRDRIASVRLRDLDAPHASDWQKRRLQAISSASVRRERNLLNNVFEIARKEWKWLRKNPFEGVRRPKDGKPRNRLVTDAELEKLKKGASADLRRAIVIAVETGMRAGEIASNPPVYGRVAVLADSKNNEGRSVPLSAIAQEALKEGVNLTAGSISALFSRLCDDLKIEGLTFHDLRHYACVHLSKKLELMELCKMMGWKDPRHALIYYSKGAEAIADKL